MDKRDIKQIYSRSEGKMVDIPEECRTSVSAFGRFKRPAFSVLQNTKRRDDKSEREKTKG